MTIVYQYLVGMEYLQLVYSWDEITTTGISKWWLVYSHDEISFWDGWWYTVVMKYIFEMTGGIQSWWQGIGRLSQQPATVCVAHLERQCSTITTWKIMIIIIVIASSFFVLALSIICITAVHHHKTICFRIPVLIHPWTTPLDIGEVSQNRNPSSKKMSHLHSRKYIFHQRNMSFSS